MGVYAGIGWSIPKVVAAIVNFFLGLANVKPVPASGDIVRMKEQVVLTNLKEELPPGCSDAVHK